MNATTEGMGPSFNTGQSHGGDAYIFVVGFFCIVVLLTSISYTSHVCKRSRSPPTIISFDDDADNNHHLITFSRGLDDDILVTFPTFLYSEATMPHKDNTDKDASGSVCSICLADYKPTQVVRLLPECNHLFHVYCIDTWLKAHPTCPMCRIDLAACGNRATIISTELRE